MYFKLVNIESFQIFIPKALPTLTRIYPEFSSKATAPKTSNYVHFSNNIENPSRFFYFFPQKLHFYNVFKERTIGIKIFLIFCTSFKTFSQDRIAFRKNWSIAYLNKLHPLVFILVICVHM